MYLCEICGTVFDVPVNREGSQLCPACGQPYISDANICPCCLAWKREQDTLCQDCRNLLRDTFGKFIGALSESAVAQLNKWLDGNSITDWRNWK